MGDPIEVYFGTASAAPKAVEWDNAMLVGNQGSSSKSNETLKITSADDLLDYGFTTDDQLYNSAADFFSAGTNPPSSLYCYIYNENDTGTCNEDLPLVFAGDNDFETPVKPPEGFCGDQRVKFFGQETISDTGVWNYADGSQGVGFTVNTDGLGNWDGTLTFPSGLSGEEGVVSDLDENAKILADVILGSKGNIGGEIERYNVNICALALENGKNLSDYSDTVFGDNQVDDLLTMLNAIAGKNCMLVYGLPGNAKPEDDIADSGSPAVKWKNLRNLVGAKQTFAPLKARPSLEAPDGDDMGAGYMGMIVTTHPHTTMTKAEPHMGIYEPESILDQTKWKNGQIGAVIEANRLSGNPYLIDIGFTFGSGDGARVNGYRCKVIIAQTLINNLYGLLAEQETLVSASGIAKIRKRITASFNHLVGNNIADGLVAINIPLESHILANDETAKLASQQRTVGTIEVEYLWHRSVEKIIIKRMVNVAI